MLCDKQECHLLFFRIREISGGGNLLWKPVSAMEISRKPSKYLPCCYLFILIMYLIIQYFMISTHLIYSPCPPQSIFIIYKRPISRNLPYRILYSLYFTVTVKYKEDRILFGRFITWNWPYIYIYHKQLTRSFPKFCDSWIKIRTAHFLWSNLFIWLIMKFSFPYANQFLEISVKKQQLSSISLLSVTVATNQFINWSPASFRRLQVWATGE